MTGGRARALFALVVAVSWGLLALTAYHAWRAFRPRVSRLSGVALNKTAWKASHHERGREAPAGGPRDGYWGKRMPKPVADPVLGWREGEAHVAGLVESDARGAQSFAVPGARQHLLILGGSVAWGSYASRLDTTYFALAAQDLARRGRPLRVTVLAAGAWESANEVQALEAALRERAPDVVLFLNGLNDLTRAGRRRTRVDLRPAYDARDPVASYLGNMERAHALAAARGVPVVFALQPLLLSKRRPSPLERRVLELSFDERVTAQAVDAGYDRLREGLARLCRRPGAHCLDCSSVFDGETATTFTDLWHFADPGHEILAAHLARGLLPVLGGPAP